jgi:hypothetical protein
MSAYVDKVCNVDEEKEQISIRISEHAKHVANI